MERPCNPTRPEWANPGMSRRSFMVGSAALTAAGLRPDGAAAQSAKKTGSPKRGGTLKVSTYLNPSTLDPITGRSAVDQSVLFAMYDTLIDFEPETLKPRPGLAKWHFPDLKTMVLDLNPGITFHDGTPCDADAVKQNIDRAMTSVRSNVKPDFVSVASVEVTGPLQVTLRLKQPDTSLTLILADRAGMMASPKAWAAAGDDFDRKPCGTGQFRFVSWADADRVIVERNPDYWKKDGQPWLDGIVFRIITDYAAGARSVQAGENDIMFLVPPRLYETLSRNKNLVTTRYPSVRVQNIFFHYGRGPLRDVRVRQAINYAVDRVGFARVTTDGTGDIASSLAPREHWAFDPEGAKRYPYDPEKAKALLKDAGYGNGVEFTMVVLPDAEYRKRADIITENFKKVGIGINLMPVQQATATFLTEKKGDLYLVAWPGRPDLTQTYYLQFSKDSYYNVSKQTPVENIEQLINATRESENLEDRRAAFAKLMQAEREAALFAPLCTEPVVYAQRTKVKGFTPSLLGKMKFDGVYIDE